MSTGALAILNIGHDRELLERGRHTEAQIRQQYYCSELPARIVHLVRAPADYPSASFDLSPQLRVVPCPVRHWSEFAISAARRGREVLKSERFDLIQVQEPYLTGVVGLGLSTLYGIPLVAGLYSDEVDNPVWLTERYLNRMANMVAKFVLRRAVATRTDSLAVAQRVTELGVRNLTHIPFLITHAEHLADPQLDAPDLRKTLLAEKTGPLLLAVCRLEPEKNLSLMLRALAQAVRFRPGLVLAVAGTGRLAEQLAREGESLIPGRVRWLGWLAAERLASYYQAADMMLISSNRESAARVLTESLLAGTPVLSTDTAGAREVIDDGVSGRIVPVADCAAFAAALVELTGDCQRLATMGTAGRHAMLGMVTGKAVVHALRNFYTLSLASAR